MSREKVSRLRQLLSEATPAIPIPSPVEVDAWRTFQRFETSAALPALEQSWQSIAMRNINRIATWYGWAAEVQRHLDRAGAHSIAALSDQQLGRLEERMALLEDCLQAGCGSPDAPPAS